MREAADRLRVAAADDELTVTQASRFGTFAFLGAALYALGRAPEAASAFQSAARLSPAQPPPADLLVNLANASLAAGRPVDARRALAQALEAAPGHVEARMLLERLSARSDIAPITGSVLGETPDSVRRYMETLTFGNILQGYDPAQVREALGQIDHYLRFLSQQLAEKDAALERQDAELSRLRGNEDGLIRTIMAAQQENERLRQQPAPAAMREDSDTSYNSAQERELTPLELLMRPKT